MIEMLVGLHVTDDEGYANYRKGMTPLLNKFGGGFGYDFKISEVLKKETKDHINRVFTIHFPSEEKMNAFFGCEQYQAVKKEYFASAVNSTTIISSYERKNSKI